MVKKKFIMYAAIFILSIMVLSTFGAIFYGKGDESVEKYEYNGYRFYKTSQGWYGVIGEKRVDFLYGPKELENVTIPKVSVLELNSYNKIYLSYRPEDSSSLTANLILNRIWPFLSKQLVQACSRDSEACKDFPIKTCNDTAVDVGVILAEESEVKEISNREGCLLFKGSGDELSKAVEKLRMKFLDVA